MALGLIVSTLFMQRMTIPRDWMPIPSTDGDYEMQNVTLDGSEIREKYKRFKQRTSIGKFEYRFLYFRQNCISVKFLFLLRYN